MCMPLIKFSKEKSDKVLMTLLQRALDLPLLSNDLKVSGSLYISDGLEEFAKAHGLKTYEKTVPFKNVTIIYLIAKLDGVELVQPVAWEMRAAGPKRRRLPESYHHGHYNTNYGRLQGGDRIWLYAESSKREIILS